MAKGQLPSCDADGKRLIIEPGADGDFMVPDSTDASGWKSKTPDVLGMGRKVALGVDRSSSDAVNWSDCTGLEFSVGSGQTFRFEFQIVYVTNSALNGIGLALNGPSEEFIISRISIPTAINVFSDRQSRAWDVGLTVSLSDNANAHQLAIIAGTLKTSAAGTLMVRFRSGLAATSSVIKAGSNGLIRRVA